MTRVFGFACVAQQVGVGDGLIGASGQRHALRPFEFHRRQRQEQRAREVAAGPDARLGQGLVDDQLRHAL